MLVISRAREIAEREGQLLDPEKVDRDPKIVSRESFAGGAVSEKIVGHDYRERVAACGERTDDVVLDEG